MSPRGRPTTAPKIGRFEIRITAEEEKMLEYCQKQTGKTKAEIVRAGIRRIYEDVRSEQ